MICFLTSRCDCPERSTLNPANGFCRTLRGCFPEPCRFLYVCSDPENREKTDFYAAVTRELFENAGFRFRSFSVLDGRNEREAAKLVKGANFIVLAGGHVPTQNRFFAKIGLKRLLRDFDGVLIGISAGSMNCAQTVYAQPEEEGEALDPDYRRFLPGLGLTQTMILPHYQEIKDELLDGLRVMEEIAYPDSLGRSFWCLPDGSYLLAENGTETVFGEAYRLSDGVLTQVSSDGGCVRLRP